MRVPHKNKTNLTTFGLRSIATCTEGIVQNLLLHLLDLTIQLHHLDQCDQPSESIERQLEQTYRDVTPLIEFNVPHIVIREEKAFYVWVNPDGITFQAELVVNDSLEATA